MNRDLPVLLTVRGTTIPSSLDAARKLHNETAGSPQGIAAARALGDLSHKVYAPCLAAAKVSSAKEGEVLFVDNWVDAQGIQTFFGNEHVQGQAAKLFASRDAAVWMPARGSFSFHLPAPMTSAGRFVGMVRGVVCSPEDAVRAFRDSGTSGLRDARRRGQLSHQLFVKLGPPADAAPVEILGMDVWTTLAGLSEHYADAAHMAPLKTAFAGPPQASVWEQAAGEWSEW